MELSHTKTRTNKYSKAFIILNNKNNNKRFFAIKKASLCLLNKTRWPIKN